MSSVAVVIAAKDAAGTIGEAVRSALAEPEVRRVVVVDDGSSDGTLAAALAANDGTNRIDAIRLDRNRGPACARNEAIARVEEDFVAILDADDFFLPGRFARLLAEPDWDMAGDNIAFVPEGEATGGLGPLRAAIERSAPRSPESRSLSLADFVEGNLTLRGRPRGELGFLKPVIRRSLLGTAGVFYDETLRLGEDYDLYTRLLLGGARFRVIRTCGYVAFVRPASLSGRHSTADLERYAAVDERLLAAGGLDARTRRLVGVHHRQSLRRFALRRFLDRKGEAGLSAAARELLLQPGAWRGVVTGVAADKLAAFGAGRRPPAPSEPIRFLFPPDRAPEPGAGVEGTMRAADRPIPKGRA